MNTYLEPVCSVYELFPREETLVTSSMEKMKVEEDEWDD